MQTHDSAALMSRTASAMRVTRGLSTAARARRAQRGATSRGWVVVSASTATMASPRLLGRTLAATASTVLLASSLSPGAFARTALLASPRLRGRMLIATAPTVLRASSLLPRGACAPTVQLASTPYPLPLNHAVTVWQGHSRQLLAPRHLPHVSRVQRASSR